MSGLISDDAFILGICESDLVVIRRGANIYTAKGSVYCLSIIVADALAGRDVDMFFNPETKYPYWARVIETRNPSGLAADLLLYCAMMAYPDGGRKVSEISDNETYLELLDALAANVRLSNKA